jgi:hypothetical protein
MNKVLKVLEYYIVGLFLSAFPFSLFSLLGWFTRDIYGELVWPVMGVVYAIMLKVSGKLA